MEQFSLPTFIKICLLDTGSRIAELQKKIETQTGYDYYNSFNRAVQAFIESGERNDADLILSQPKNEHEQKNNTAAFEAFIKKFGACKSLSLVKSRKNWSPKGANFSIIVAPLFEIEKAGNRQVFSTWALQKPLLTQKYGAVSCYVMRQAFASHSLANAGFFLYDLTNGKTYSEKQITNTTSKIFQSDVRWLTHELSDLA